MKKYFSENNKKGFTLSELLVAIAILSLCAGLMAVGISTAVKTYRAIDDASAAEMMLSNGMTMLRSELADASSVVVEDSSVRYYSGAQNGEVILSSAEDGLMIAAGGQAPRPLMPEGPSANGMHMEYEDVTLNDDCITFTDLRVLRGGEVFAEAETYSIRIVGQFL